VLSSTPAFAEPANHESNRCPRSAHHGWLNPPQREGTPHTVQEIETRILELAFSANFMR
jgi:hypothetical protein